MQIDGCISSIFTEEKIMKERTETNSVRKKNNGVVASAQMYDRYKNFTEADKKCFCVFGFVLVYFCFGGFWGCCG